MTSPSRAGAISILGASVLFSVGNMLWRIPTESPVMLAILRGAVAAVLLAPVAVRTGVPRPYRAILHDRGAWPAVALSAASIWVACWMFSTTPGPLAATMIGVVPMLTLLVTAALGRRTTRTKAALAITCTAAAVVAGDLSALTAFTALTCAVFVCHDIATSLAMERARRRHAAIHLVHVGLVLASAPAPLVLSVHGTGFSPLGVTVVCVIAMIGTTGQVLRAHGLPLVGAPTAATATQVTALLTAVGGVLVFGDDIDPLRLTCLLVASACAVVALSLPDPASSLTLSEVREGAALEEMAPEPSPGVAIDGQHLETNESKSDRRAA